MMRQIIATTQMDWPKRFVEVERIQEKFATDEKAEESVDCWDEDAWLPRRLGFFNGRLWLFEEAAAAVARARATDAGIAVHRFRLARERLPANLEELVPEFLPEVPRDPFTGELLHYHVRKDEYVVYSIGKNRSDDGGREEQRGEPDVVFHVRLRADRAGQSP